jgi:hypothetical protein
MTVFAYVTKCVANAAGGASIENPQVQMFYQQLLHG